MKSSFKKFVKYIDIINFSTRKDFNVQRKNEINASSCNLFRNSRSKNLSSITDSH